MQRLFNQHPKLRPLSWIRISRPPLGPLDPPLLTLIMPLQPRVKTPKRRQTAVDEALGLPATASLFCGFSFSCSLPPRLCKLRGVEDEFSLSDFLASIGY